MNRKGKMISCILAVTVVTSMVSAIPVFADTASTSKVTTQISQSVSASHRLAGINRYSTAVAISQKGWSTSDTVILASGENYADALTSGPLAKKYNAPILLTSKSSINAETIAEMGRLQANNIIIIGSEGAVYKSVATQLNTAGFSSITRIGGINRYETSTMVAAKLDKPSAVVIVSGQDFPDALSVSSVASKLGYSIILSEKLGLSDSAKKYIVTNGIKKSYIIGGQAVLYPAIEKQVTDPVRLAGVNRYETNLAVLKAFEGEFNYDNIFVATGNNFADALAGGALASKSSSPMILVGSSMNANTADYLVSKENLNTKILALGGEAIVSDSIVKSAIDDKSDIAVTKSYSSAGTYSDGAVSGSVIISEAGVNLKNTTISGDLLIASTVGEGNVDLDNVIVTGKIIINGGGSNSVKLHNMHSKSVEIDKATGESVRVATDATSSIEAVLVSTSGIVDQTLASKKGSITVDNDSSVVLKGGFDTVQVNGQGSTVKVIGGTIATLNVNATSSKTIVDVDVNSTVASIAVNNNVSITGTGVITSVTVAKAGVNVNLQAKVVGTVLVSAAAVGSEVNISSATTVTDLNVNAAVKVSGKGTITNANIGVNGTTISITPVVTSLTAGVSAVVNGAIKDSTNSTVITSVPTSATPATPTGSTGGIGSAAGSAGSATVLITTITVTGIASVVNGQILQLGATVEPSNATNKLVMWSVVSGPGTIDANGLLTTTGVGTIIVKATSNTSGVSGTKAITVTAPEVTVTNVATLSDLTTALANVKITTININDEIVIPDTADVNVRSNQTLNLNSKLIVEGKIEVNGSIIAPYTPPTMARTARMAITAITEDTVNNAKLEVKGNGKISIKAGSSMEFANFSDIITPSQDSLLLYTDVKVKIGNKQYIGDNSAALIKLSNFDGSSEPVAGYFFNGDGILLLVIFEKAEVLQDEADALDIAILVKAGENGSPAGELEIPDFKILKTLINDDSSVGTINIEANGKLIVNVEKVVSANDPESIFSATGGDLDNRRGILFSKLEGNIVCPVIHGNVIMNKAFKTAIIQPEYFGYDDYYKTDLKPTLDIKFEPKTDDFAGGYWGGAVPVKGIYEIVNHQWAKVTYLSAYNAALAAVTKSDYTEASWAAYQIIVSSNLVTVANTQAEVDAAISLIIAAQSNLTKVAPAVISVTVNPATATVGKGATKQLTASVVIVGGAAQTVNWISNDSKVTVDETGLVTVAADAVDADYTITAISTLDGSKTGTSIITVTATVADVINLVELIDALANVGISTININGDITIPVDTNVIVMPGQTLVLNNKLMVKGGIEINGNVSPTSTQSGVLLYAGAKFKSGDKQYIGNAACNAVIELSNFQDSTKPVASYLFRGDKKPLLAIFEKAEVIQTIDNCLDISVLVKAGQFGSPAGELKISDYDIIKAWDSDKSSGGSIFIEANGNLKVSSTSVVSASSTESVFNATGGDSDNRRGIGFSKNPDNSIMASISGDVIMNKIFNTGNIRPQYYEFDSFYGIELKPTLDIKFNPVAGDFTGGYWEDPIPVKCKYEMVDNLWSKIVALNKELVSIATLSGITVANGTNESDIGLPSSVVVNYTDVDNNSKTMYADIIWASGVNYVSTTAGIHNFNGMVTLPVDINNDANVSLFINQPVIVLP